MNKSSIRQRANYLLIFGLLVLLCGQYFKNQKQDTPFSAEQTEFRSSKKLISTPARITNEYYYPVTVLNVVDGDTIDVSIPVWIDITIEKRIRFDRVDTWEVRGKNKEKGFAAKAYLEMLLNKGQVYIKTDGRTGKYGRTIASVYVKSGEETLDIQKLLQEGGHAKDE